jgi:hypothetical protein
MKSPFPGMDPYLERHWGDVHHRFIQYTSDMLQSRLPEDLLARIEERVFLENRSNSRRQIIPDIHVSEVYPQSTEPPAELRDGEAAIAEPIVFEVDEVEIREGYITIRVGDRGQIITVLEFLSPTNKRPGPGQQKYLEKQTDVLRSSASLVEIDLLRSGDRILALTASEIPPEHANDYLACVRPGWKASRRELYVMPLRQRLPILPIPLRAREQRVELDMQAVVDQAYASGRYHKLDYRLVPDPPLPTQHASWAEELLKAAAQPQRGRPQE